MVQAFATFAANQTTTQHNTRPVTIIEKPQSFKGHERDSETAWLFRQSFRIWAKQNIHAFAAYDAQNHIMLDATTGHPILDEEKLITLALLFMQDKAGTWAHPYLEEIADGRPVFNN